MDHWLGISSANYSSHCGDTDGYTIQNALDGLAGEHWRHYVDEVHWFVLDLGQTHTIKKIRGRSYSPDDPIDINIYIDNNNPPTTLVYEGITTWRDGGYPTPWVEIDIADSDGRYIKVEIENTEDYSRRLRWLAYGGSIFDVYGDVKAEDDDLCTWIEDIGGPAGLTITDIFDTIDSYIFQIPPSGYSFIPTIQQAFGVIDYYLGYDGGPGTGCPS